ncbi:hypothetical protein FPK46_28215, partial [Acinetobacter baumannii]|nr:hypothetical protein [Acinetobacter baumannii]
RDLLALPVPPPLAWAAALAVMLAGLACSVPHLRQRGVRQDRARSFAAALLAATGMLLLVTQRTAGAPGAAISLLLGWATLWLALLYPRRT